MPVSPENKPPQRRFYNRSEACELLGGISKLTLREFEDAGRLTPVRLTGRKRGTVFFSHDEIMQLCDSLFQKAKAKRKTA
jgi:hypothetical protein